MSDWNQDEQARAEALDDDVVGGETIPPDQPLGLPELLGRDVTVPGEYAPDSVEERSVREQTPPDEAQDPFGLHLELVDDDGGADVVAASAEPDIEDVVVLSDEPRPRPDDPSPEAAALHLVEDDAAR